MVRKSRLTTRQKAERLAKKVKVEKRARRALKLVEMLQAPISYKKVKRASRHPSSLKRRLSSSVWNRRMHRLRKTSRRIPILMQTQNPRSFKKRKWLRTRERQ